MTQLVCSCPSIIVRIPGSQYYSNHYHTSSFFVELSDVLDHVATVVDPLYVVGDVNIRLDSPDDPSSRQLIDVLTSYGLSCRLSTPTHDLGGLLDIVAIRDDLSTPSVDVINVGLSDHRLLSPSFWISRTTR